jgi:hypothetical protein
MLLLPGRTSRIFCSISASCFLLLPDSTMCFFRSGRSFLPAAVR